MEIPGFENVNPDPDYQYDDNDMPYAVIKVRTENITDQQRRDLRFESNNAVGIVLEYKTGEVWVYITAKSADFLKISHPDFGNVEFAIPFDLQPKKGYEVTLVNKTAAASSGWASLTIQTKPESGAKILLNGRDMNATTPYANNMFPTGSYEITVSKHGFKTIKETVDIQDGENKIVEIDMPYLYGKLHVASKPSGVNILVDGKDYGVTPTEITINVGNRELRLEKVGYATVVKTVNIVENQMINIDEKLVTGKEISIATDGTGDKIFVDGNYMGVSPLTESLSLGNHEVRAVRDKEERKKTITVTAKKGVPSVQLTFFANKTITVKGVTFEMVAITGGTFAMGSSDKYAGGNERPIHQVTVSDFLIGRFEVTQKLWKAVMGDNPSYFKGDDLPVERVSWNDVQTFIQSLNWETGLNFRLPTEAEWEYAARGGTKSSLYNGEDIKVKGRYNSPNLDKLAWYGGNCGQNYTTSAGCDVSPYYNISRWSEKQYDDSKGGTHPVGLKQPNAYGLYDMLGNATEWCQDYYANYWSGDQTNPQGPSRGSNRVLRGGSWNNNARNCRVSNRNNNNPDNRNNNNGFRLVLVP